MVAPLDFWTLGVQYVFGSFWLAVIGIALLIFVIMGLLGRISIYSTMWYCIMFLLAMTIGYGFVLLNLIVTALLILAVYFSAKSYIESK